MVAVLAAITTVTAAAVGAVYNVTADPIARAKGQKKVSALAEVLPGFDNTPSEEVDTVAVGGGELLVYTARMGGQEVGYAVESFTNSGFSGLIRIMVGFEPDGTIRNISVLEQNETPGLGAKIAVDGNPVKVSFVGYNPADLKMAVRKDGGDIDAITASTISSRAYVQAVERAYAAFRQVRFGDDAADSVSGATSLRNDPAGQNAADAMPAADSASGATMSAADSLPAADNLDNRPGRERRHGGGHLGRSPRGVLNDK